MWRAERRGGFTLLEVAVSLVVMLTLAAVVVPAARARIDRARVASAEAALESLYSAIADFHEDVGDWPLTLSQLHEPIGAADVSGCFALFGAAAAGRWRGPYLSRQPTPAGVPVGIGTAANLTFVIGSTLYITVPAVPAEQAEALDQRVDGGDGALGGGIRWLGPDAEAMVLLTHLRPARC